MITEKRELKNVPIADLIPYARNPRKNDPAVQRIAASLKEYGFVKNSIVVDEDMVLITGHTTTKAMQALKWVTAPEVTQVFGLTKAQKKAYRIADNKLGELAAWDEELLALEFEDLKGLDFDVDLTGFDEKEIGKIDNAGKGAHEDDYEPPAVIETDIQRGDLFALGRHRILCGDCTNQVDVARLLDGAAIDCLITDPPYCSGGFQEAGRSKGSIGSTVKRSIKNDTLSTRGYQTLLKSTLSTVDLQALYIFTDWRMWVTLFDLVEASGYGVRSMIVWDKKSMGLGRGWRAQHELILHARTSSASALFDNKIGIGNVVAISRTGNKNHPTEKPVQLIEEILKITAGARTIYDPFAGSGTTLLACEARGRTCYASEMVPEFCQVIVNRWEKLTGQKAERVDAS